MNRGAWHGGHHPTAAASARDAITGVDDQEKRKGRQRSVVNGTLVVFELTCENLGAPMRQALINGLMVAALVIPTGLLSAAPASAADHHIYLAANGASARSAVVEPREAPISGDSTLFLSDMQWAQWSQPVRALMRCGHDGQGAGRGLADRARAGVRPRLLHHPATHAHRGGTRGPEPVHVRPDCTDLLTATNADIRNCR